MSIIAAQVKRQSKWYHNTDNVSASLINGNTVKSELVSSAANLHASLDRTTSIVLSHQHN